MGEIPAADRAAEQDVADQCQHRFGVVEYNMARRVPGAMTNVEGQFADRDLVAVVEPARWLERATGDTVLGAVLGKAVNPVTIGLVRPFDLHAEFLGENSGAAAMVDMAMRQQDLLNRDSGLLRGGLEPRQIPTRIDERAVHRRRAP